MERILIRAARRSDSAQLLEWRNDAEAVAASISSDRVSPEEHAEWLDRVLADPARTLLIGEIDGRPIGTCRFDADGTDASEVSINLAPEERGRGLSRAFLSAAIDHYRVNARGPLTAVIRLSNGASLRLFESLGFVEVSRDERFARLERVAVGREEAGPLQLRSVE